MNQRRQQIESSVSNKQETIWTEKDILWIMQFSSDISKDNE